MLLRICLVMLLCAIAGGGCRSIDTQAVLADANAHFEAGDYVTAINAYTFLLEDSPNSVIALNNRGLSRYHTDDYAGALRDFDKCLSLAPTFAAG